MTKMRKVKSKKASSKEKESRARKRKKSDKGFVWKKMAQKAIRGTACWLRVLVLTAGVQTEYDGKRMLYEFCSAALPPFVDPSLLRVALVNLDPQHGFSDKKVLAGKTRWRRVFRFVLLTRCPQSSRG